MKFEDKWAAGWEAAFKRLPFWVPGVLVGWSIVSFAFAFFPPMRENVPQWFLALMGVPLVVAFIWFLPMVFARMVGQIYSPIRKALSHFGKRD